MGTSQQTIVTIDDIFPSTDTPPHHFDTLIDVRSPCEYQEDHLPGAISAPVLYDTERETVGTMHKTHGAFAARRHGAALVAHNIAHHLQTQFAQQTQNWKPLIYCWRGGQRSASLCHIFNRIGWASHQLQGGYKSYRRHVLTALNQLPLGLPWVILCGPTGCGKSHLLHTLSTQGAQVLHLEDLARHRGSILGAYPEEKQPSQRAFESALYTKLRSFTPHQPIFVEAESRKIGQLHLPDTLIHTLRLSPCIRLELSTAQRVEWLLQEYIHWQTEPETLIPLFNTLLPLHGHQLIQTWQTLAQTGQWEQLVHSLLDKHYDTLYQQGMARNYGGYGKAVPLPIPGLSPTDWQTSAHQAIHIGEEVMGLRAALRGEG